MKRSAAEILREYGPFPGVDSVHGVTYDGRHVWFASGDKLNAFDPASGKTVRSIDVAAHAGTAFDGQHLFQLAEDRIQKIDPKTGRVLATIPAPGGGGDSGLAWAEGTLWVGQDRDRKIHQIDPQTGAILRTIESNRFVTGVTWIDGELWHGTWEGDESDLRRVDPRTGEILERLEMPPGVGVSGLESDLLRRRKQREGESRPPPQARLRARQRLSPVDSTRLGRIFVGRIWSDLIGKDDAWLALRFPLTMAPIRRPHLWSWTY
jgi:glutamine cyclotransferase